MSEAKHTAGPWGILKLHGATCIGVLPVNGRGKPRHGRDTEDVAQCESEADARLIAAAPAYAVAWELVPHEIRERIFDALHKPDTEWVESAIAKASA